MIDNIPREVWKPIEGYEGLYEVSNMGRVRSVDRVLPHNEHGTWHLKEKVLKQHWAGPPNSTYLTVWLHKGHGEQHQRTVHRLVAQAFIPNPEGKEQVNHINCDRSDNRLSNLEWTTPLENTQHAWEHGRCEMIGKHQMKEVVNVETGERFKSIKEASDKYGATHRAYYQVMNNPSRTCRGYHWMTAERYDLDGPMELELNKNVRPVIQYDIDTGKEIARFNSISDASKQTMIHNTAIGSCCRGEYHTAGGFKWRYDDGKRKAV